MNVECYWTEHIPARNVLERGKNIAGRTKDNIVKERNVNKKQSQEQTA
jgi:hypothetical protein